ncbi:MAG: hypothetical protein WCS96_04155, partial [Victivallales bacterium]
VREEFFAEVPHRQFVFTIPKRLRIYFRFNRDILRKPQNIFIFFQTLKKHRILKITPTGHVVYKAEHDSCRKFPEPASGDLRAGVNRNFQVFDPLDFLAEVTQHIPNKGGTHDKILKKDQI